MIIFCRGCGWRIFIGAAWIICYPSLCFLEFAVKRLYSTSDMIFMSEAGLLIQFAGVAIDGSIEKCVLMPIISLI